VAKHRSKKRLRIVGLVVPLGLAGGAAAMLNSSAMAGPTPGTNTYYGFPSGTGSLHDVTWTTTPQSDPGYTADVFWSHQFAFDNNQTAYFGMQSDGGDKRHVLFSVWDATDARKSPVSTCENFDGEGSGKHCSALLDWQAGHTYEFTVAPTAQPGWFGATVTDTTTHTSTDLGSIKTNNATGISPGGMDDWTEYFEWGSPQSNCYNQPATSVAFGVPKANGGTISATVSGSQVNDTCKSMAKVKTTPQGSVQRGAIGNTTRGMVQHAQQCLSSPDGSTAALSDCAEESDRAWVYAVDHTLRLRNDTCLAVDGTNAAVRDCRGTGGEGRVEDPAELWAYDPTAKTLKNSRSGRCLAVGGDGAPTTEDCAGTAAQQWTLPTADGTGRPPTPAVHSGPLSDQPWTIATNGWGPVEKDLSNGERAAHDGRTLTIRGTTYAKGLGVHAASSVAYDLGGKCQKLTVDVGVDDETGGQGSVDFQIYRDTTKVADSGTLTGESAVKHLSADLTGGSTLRLVVTKSGQNIDHDHADWADPQHSCG
jgi:hypothetical protein